MTIKVYIEPNPRLYVEDGTGGGGISRVNTALGKWLPAYDIEVVDSEQDADIVAIHAGSLINTNKPICSICHGLYWTGDFEWHTAFWQYNVSIIEALRRAVKVFVPSEWVAYPIRRDMRKEVVVIPHGIEFEEFEPQREHQGYVLWGKPRVDVVCDPQVVNELAERATIIQFVTTFGRPAPNVKVVGAMPYKDFQRLLDGAMIWLATARETGDIGSREAMARGIPVLGWKHGATAELVKHKETGYLAEVGNLDDLLEGLQYCLAHRQRLGMNAREEIRQHHQWKQQIARYAEELKEIYRNEQYDVDITIVVPAYNYARFLPECLASIREQDFKGKVEVIVVDDASTDETQSVLQGLVWPGLRIVRHESNQGLCAALNTGHREARGKYIINLDADNLLAPEALRTLYEALEKKPWVDVASGGLMRYSSNGQHVVQTDWPFERVDPLGQLNHINQILSTSLMRKRAIERLGGYRLRQRKNEDGEFWCRAVSAGLRFERVTKQPVLIYRSHGKNKSNLEGGEDDPHGPLSWNFYYPWRDKTNIMPFACTVPAPRGSWAVRSYEKPHIAVVIPCGPGHQKYLVDALDSVAGQTFQNIECIVANDTGKPLDVAKMGHPWVKVVEVGDSKGPAIARNTAIAAARAPLILPLDADDMLYPEAIANFYQAWLQFPDCLVYADCEIEDSPTSSHPYQSGPWSYEGIKREAIYQVPCLFAKQWWEAVGGFPVDVPGGVWEDWLFGIKLHIAGIGATYAKFQWGRYRHWTAGLHGSKNAIDNAETGTPQWRERLARIYEWIAQKEAEMGCTGCSKRRTQTIQTGKTFTASAKPLSEEVTVIYEGPRAGGFTINSRVFPGKKIYVERGMPFVINKGDSHILQLPGMRQFTEEEGESSFPREQPKPPEIRVEPAQPPPAIAPPSQPESHVSLQTKSKDGGWAQLENIKYLKADMLKEVGLDSLDKIREDLEKGGLKLQSIKGIGPKTLARIKEVAFG